MEDRTVSRINYKRSFSNDDCGKRFDTLQRVCDQCSSKIVKQQIDNQRIPSRRVVITRDFDFGTPKTNTDKVTIKMGGPTAT